MTVVIHAVRHLRDATPADVGSVGGKAAGLGVLLAMGTRVPDGVVLDVRTGAMATDERTELLRDVVAILGNGPFAVRSSAVAEDGGERSFAGMYESVLDVPLSGLSAALDRVLASGDAPRVTAYGQGPASKMAVIIQHMLAPIAAGVVLTADPISGDRRSTVITAVVGTGDRLVTGSAMGDEWLVRDGRAVARRCPEQAIDARQARVIATEAARIAAERAAPQDIEWAIDSDGVLWILQARDMTALPPDISWEAPAPGAYTRQLRLGEWISGPVTPLFESWLLSTLEERLHARLLEWIGQRAPLPHHVVVNGWYFYSLNWIAPGSMLRSLPDILWHLVRSPRRVVGVVPSLARHSFPVFEREWRSDLQPRYLAAVASAERQVETLPAGGLPGLIDGLAEIAGDYFASIAALTGAAYKLEMNLARFHRRHVAPSLGSTHLPLVSGFEIPTKPGRHAVSSLDWWYAPAEYVSAPSRPDADHAIVVETRQEAEAAAFRVLAAAPRRLSAFRRLLVDAQHLVPIREEQTAEWTLAWPVMRRAVLRIGEALVENGVLSRSEDVFFLTRDEAVLALAGGPTGADLDPADRRARLAGQAALVPPLMVGRLNPRLKAAWDAYPGLVGAVRSETALVSGAPASPGRATGPVRVIRGPETFGDLLPGEILVAPMTAPAWTPLFTLAAAVVTDVGSAAAHASIIAREYGIPAIVGCGDATSRLRTGMRVTVDGGTGNVEPA